MTFFDEVICEVIDIALYASSVWEVIGSDLKNVHIFGWRYEGGESSTVGCNLWVVYY